MSSKAGRTISKCFFSFSSFKILPFLPSPLQKRHFEVFLVGRINKNFRKKGPTAAQRDRFFKTRTLSSLASTAFWNVFAINEDENLAVSISVRFRESVADSERTSRRKLAETVPEAASTSAT